MRKKKRKFSIPGSEPEPALEAGELPERWSTQRKTGLVLPLLRGDALDTVSRESQVSTHELERWNRVFLESGARADVEDPERSGGARADAGAGEDRRVDDEVGTVRIPHRKKGSHGRLKEAAAMRHGVRPGTGRRYPLTMICAVFRVPGSTVYLTLAPAPVAPVLRAKRRPEDGAH